MRALGAHALAPPPPPPPLSGSCCSYLQQQSGAPQQRRFISVDVPNGNVDKAWRTLSRKLREEGYIDKAQSKKFFVKPSEQRKVEAASSRRRYRKQQFRCVQQC